MKLNITSWNFCSRHNCLLKIKQTGYLCPICSLLFQHTTSVLTGVGEKTKDDFSNTRLIIPWYFNTLSPEKYQITLC